MQRPIATELPWLQLGRSVGYQCLPSMCPIRSWHRPGRLAGFLSWLLTRAWLRVEEKNKGCNWTVLRKKRVTVGETFVPH